MPRPKKPKLDLPPIKKRPLLEKDIEKKGGKYAESKGVAHYKFASPAHRGVPDRILLAPIPEWLRPIIAKHIRFIEFKRPGKIPKLTGPQEREIARLRELGFEVRVINSVAETEWYMDDMVK